MWYYFEIFAIISMVTWLVSFFFFFVKEKKAYKITQEILALTGILSISIFITLLWIELERPPMRTLGETRLWYSFFLSICGFLIYKKWKYKWFLSYSIFMSFLFLAINYFQPETHNKALMPALQSIWFVPHVIVYMLSYALLAASCIIGFKGLYEIRKKQSNKDTIILADNVVNVGFGFLTMGLIFGALWAKEAWGHYWTWDPKETWAFITWLMYLLYIHFRFHEPQKIKTHYKILAFAFIILLICWFGINYLPSARFSVHVYS